METGKVGMDVWILGKKTEEKGRMGPRTLEREKERLGLGAWALEVTFWFLTIKLSGTVKTVPTFQIIVGTNSFVHNYILGSVK